MFHADTSIRRNLTERIAIERETYRMEKEREAAYDAIQDIEDDAEYDRRFKEIHDRYDTTALYRRGEALEYPETRNEWFKGFFASFGLCESRSISPRQTAVFLKYAEHSHNSHYAERYYIRVGSRIARISYYGDNRPGYLTITEY